MDRFDPEIDMARAPCGLDRHLAIDLTRIAGFPQAGEIVFPVMPGVENAELLGRGRIGFVIEDPQRLLPGTTAGGGQPDFVGIEGILGLQILEMDRMQPFSGRMGQGILSTHKVSRSFFQGGRGLGRRRACQKARKRQNG